MSVSLATKFRRSLNYRLGRFYNSFYYAQSNNKYVMLIAFPAFIWYVRYRADTKLGYRLYISPTAGGPLDYLELSEIPPNQKSKNNDSFISSSVEFLADKYKWFTNKVFKPGPMVKYWENGRKIYLSDDLTVRGLKKLLYGDEESSKDVLVGCKGRVMNDNDNLALATRAFCKRDPRLVLWREGEVVH
ncbi:conserved hypothetical protein [Theileria orientalis strain Shintoku]|uniref:Uncharacterized protein n=1 Tax=Theileria orientalis strain Shintoku TaxID=869250 RepID=J4DAE1_THEOR|nr:conserved hypothetical protein [Theileria orientalis strain Shintoku]BAM41915.1 conserved hypothetical protein [Theileria orientalis strain Shintoku]|eukprot:XP_009692216.1 conserved hypothetical protein [Theileria orientalis strain Shintoku]